MFRFHPSQDLKAAGGGAKTQTSAKGGLTIVPIFRFVRIQSDPSDVNVKRALLK